MEVEMGLSVAGRTALWLKVEAGGNCWCIVEIYLKVQEK